MSAQEVATLNNNNNNINNNATKIPPSSTTPTPSGAKGELTQEELKVLAAMEEANR